MGWMPRAYPRSFRRLLALGFVLVGVPAVVGLAAVGYSVSSFATRAERAVYEARLATKTAREFAEAVTALERSARQSLILGDRSLLQAYDANRRRFSESLEVLRALANDERMRAELEEAGSREVEIHAALTAALPGGTRAGVAPGEDEAQVRSFGRLREISSQVQRETADRVDREADALRETALGVRRVAMVQAGAFVPLVALLIAGFTVLVGRPIRQLDAAIRRLGAGNLGEPVRVEGPDDLVELGRRLDWMRSALIDLERDKNRFMQEVAHSLKTSLAALREGTELLSDGTLGRLSDEQREIAEILRRNAIELQELILGLLQYGQAWTQRMALSPSVWECGGLVDEVLRKHGLAQRAKGVRVHADVRAGFVRADRTKVAAILDNLLSNAVRYSPDGGMIEVSARIIGQSLVLEVVDDGPGVSRSERERIFDPFVQGRAVGSGLVPGSGIGLSIAREHAIAHGGRIELVDSERGARFRVTLPLER